MLLVKLELFWFDDIGCILQTFKEYLLTQIIFLTIPCSSLHCMYVCVQRRDGEL